MDKKITLDSPIILHEGKNTLEDLKNLQKEYKIWQIIDIYQDQLKELFEINNPALKNDPSYQNKCETFIRNKLNKGENRLNGCWVYFPWNGNLIHMVNEDDYLKLRTNRNKNLITDEEQLKLYESCIGIVGLSVGSGISVGLSQQGISRHLKLAEFDTLETTNLNRVRAGINQIGINKLTIAKQQTFEINPFTRTYDFPQGLTTENLDQFINSNPKPAVIFEIIDDFEMKIRLRIKAKEAGIPVIMFSNLEDSIMIDIERFDLNNEVPLFNGRLGKLPEKILRNPNIDKNKYAVDMVGIENVPQKALNSVKEIGKTLIGRPQLSSTVAVSSALAVYLARCIILKYTLPSGRSHIKFKDFFSQKI